MKAVNTVLKVVAALAVVAGAVYVIAAYGDKIVAWAKKVLGSLPCRNSCDAAPVADEDFADFAAPAEEPEEVPAEEPAEAPAEESVDPADPVAEDQDFEG